MRHRLITIVSSTAMALAGCSSAPRNFAPELRFAPAQPEVYAAKWRACRQQVADSSKHRRDRLHSATVGAAVGTGAGVAGAAVTSGTTYATIGGAAVAGAAVVAAVPVLGLAGAWAMSKVKKTKKEKAVKAATAECLAESGYSVAGWRVMSKRELRQLGAAARTPAARADDLHESAATPK